ncbi:hypothetical protein [Streptosporangium sp. NPDC023615]|uniref:right-handed parallel beta-helix repeat-containing protein n=1 Tax=Streptosporangium sp. NPDC023615 TaxID=3154794 RepID=UPI003428802F
MRPIQRWRALRPVTASAILGLLAAAVPGTTAASSATAATVHYVAPNGSDSAAGTQAAPWASIARAQSAARPGDTVYLRGGTYAYTRANGDRSSRTARVDAITLNKSGTSGNPIRYWAHPGEGTPAGRAANVFRGCRAWWNADDGYDLISTYSPVTIEHSWSWRNGYVPGTTTPSGNGAGFKVGGFGAEYDPRAVKHTVRFSVAFLNKAAGFYSNHHPVANDYVNNTAYGNRPNFNMLGITSGGAAADRGTLRNNLAYNGTPTSNMTGSSSAYNSWDLGVPLSDAQFQSVSTSGWDAPRQAGGDLPVLPHLRPAANSSLIDKGTDVGLPYTGRAPDLGAFSPTAQAAAPHDRRT